MQRSGCSPMDIRAAQSPGDVAVVRELWKEYWESFGLPLDFQGFGNELQGLPGVYGAAGGMLLLATFHDEPAGTVALRRLDQAAGEVKRLYLRPKYRGQGLGRRLLEAVLEGAAAIGYERLYADTLPSMVDALSLYQRAGFELIEAYSSVPTPGAIYMKRELVSPQKRRRTPT
jgi:putative acetyltransferase